MNNGNAMNDTVIIRISSLAITDTSEVDWFLFVDNTLYDRGQSALNTLFEQLQTMITGPLKVQVIIPTDAVLLTKVNIPSKNVHHIKQALPFLVEELILEEIEQVHMALAPRASDAQGGDIHVAVINHNFLINLLDVFIHQKLQPQLVTLDSLCLPDTTFPYLLVDGKTLHICKQPYLSFCCPVEDCSAFIDDLRHETGGLEHVALYLSSEQSAELIPGYDSMNVTVFKESISEVMAVSLQRQLAPFNLLQGGYKPVEAGKTIASGPVHFFGGIAAALLIFMTYHLLAGWYFSYRADQVYQDTVNYYKKLIPNERRVISPRRQLQTHLNNGKASSASFLNLLGRFSEEFKAFSQNNALSVSELRFSQVDQKLFFDLKGESIEQLDQLKQRLDLVGLQATIGSARVQGDIVLGDLVVEAKL